ncbi:MAG: ABC transporter ATP-binding protein [Myxococcales bacterium]|nr:ABC transporter ATP-binding protein [Myxococcales bacterium]MCB9733471.1 ABC transporter ATP-binding protein [Deltaproteobacteria bacterium]
MVEPAPPAASSAAASSVLLACQQLRKSYATPGRRGVGGRAELEVLRGVDLTIGRGDMASIVGQSGVGKSTLLQILGTLDHPTSGRVLYEGTDVFGLPAGKLAAFRNARIGFVFQFHHLLAEFTALENVMLPALIGGLHPKKAEEIATGYLAEVGLAERRKHKPGELSGGEAQRVAIARALAMSPQIVFADEPTGNLDTKTSDEIHHLLVELNARLGTAFLVVTHNVRLAWLLRRHLLLEDGVVRELADDEAPEQFLPKKDARGTA